MSNTMFPWGLDNDIPRHFMVSLERDNDDDSYFVVPHDNLASITFVIKDRAACNAFLAKLFQVQKSLELYLQGYDSRQADKK